MKNTSLNDAFAAAKVARQPAGGQIFTPGLPFATGPGLSAEYPAQNQVVRQKIEKGT
jgi:hypothetical protein